MSSCQSVTKETEEDFIAAQRERLSTKSRTELQNELESRGMKSNGSKASMVEKLLEIHRNDLMDSSAQGSLTESHETPSRIEITSQKSDDGTIQILLMMMQQDRKMREEEKRKEEEIRREEKEIRREEKRKEEEIRREEKRKEEENRREDQRRFEQLILELKRSSDESQKRLISRIDSRSEDKNANNTTTVDLDYNVTNLHVFQAKFERLYNEACSLIDQLQSKLMDKDPCTYPEIETIMERCEISMGEIRTLIDKMEYVEDREETEEMYDSFDSIKKTYYTIIPEAKAYLRELKRQEDEEKNAGPLPPNIIPPEFYGNILAFPTFWDAFEPLIHNNSTVSTFFKLKYLKDSMKGSAQGVLDGYELTAKNYKAAVEHIMSRWSKPKAISRRLISTLLDSEKTNDDFRSLQKLLDKSRTKWSLIEKNNVTLEDLMVQIIEKQLPTKMEEEWVEKTISPMIEKNQSPSIDMLLKFMESKLNAKEALFHSRKNQMDKPNRENKNERRNQSNWYRHQPTNYSSKNTDKYNSSCASKEKVCSAQSLITKVKGSDMEKNAICGFCRENHELYDCSSFQKLNDKDRHHQYHLNMRHLCIKCLRSKETNGHPKTSYKCDHRCSKCQGFHHHLLHLNNEKRESKQTSHVNTSDENKTLLATVLTSTQPNARNAMGSIDTILPTAKARIYNGSNNEVVRIGLDSLSNMTFITNSLVQKLGLDSTETGKFTVQGFGGHEVTENQGRMFKAYIGPVNQENCEERILIEGHIKDGEICSSFEPLNINLKQCDHLTNLKYADEFSTKSEPIDILLGARYYYQIMKGDAILPKEDERAIKPIAMNSLFGYVIAGPYLKETITDDNLPEKNFSTYLIHEKRTMPHTSWEQLDSKLERFWNQDSIGLVDRETVLTQDEREDKDIFEKKKKKKRRKQRRSRSFGRS